MDHAFGCIEMRLRLDHVQRRLQRLGTWRALGRLVEAARQPAAEAPSADRPSLAMAVDVEIGEGAAVRGVEQLGRPRQVNQYIGLLRAAPRRFSVLLRYGLVERRYPAACLLQFCPKRFECGTIVLLQRYDPLKYFRHERRARISNGSIDQSFQRITDLLGAIDGGGNRILDLPDAIDWHHAKVVVGHLAVGHGVTTKPTCSNASLKADTRFPK
jgi:hypothetical protein